MSWKGWGPPSGGGGTFNGGTITNDLKLPDNVSLIFGTLDKTDISFNATDLIWNQVAGAIVYQNGGTEAYRLTPGGALSLKSSTNLLLGDTTILSFSVSSGNTIMNQASGDWLMRSGGTNALLVRSDLSVRIPDTLSIGFDAEPSAELHIKQTTGELVRLESTDSGNPEIFTTYHNTSGEVARVGVEGALDDFFINNKTAAGFLYLATNDTTRFTIDNSGNLGYGADPSEATALAHFVSTTKGMIFTPMTAANMLAISSPASGLMVFVNDTEVQTYFTYDTNFVKWKSPEHIILTNETGGTVTVGQAVIIKVANNFSVSYSTSSHNKLICGVVVVGGADEALIIVKYAGEVDVDKVAGSFSAGDFVVVSTTSGSVQSSTTGQAGTMGVILEDTSGSQVRILMNPLERF